MVTVRCCGNRNRSYISVVCKYRRGFNPVADGGVYFGATNSTLSIFGATRLMNGYIYHVVVTWMFIIRYSRLMQPSLLIQSEITAQPKDQLHV